MQILKIFCEMGIKKGLHTINFVNTVKNLGGTDIKIRELSKDMVDLSCKVVDGNTAYLKLDYANNKQFLSKISEYICDSKQYKYINTHIATLKKGKILTQIDKQITFQNGKKVAENTVLNNKLTGTTFIRKVNANGDIKYYRQRKNQKTELLFA